MKNYKKIIITIVTLTLLMFIVSIYQNIFPRLTTYSSSRNFQSVEYELGLVSFCPDFQANRLRRSITIYQQQANIFAPRRDVGFRLFSVVYNDTMSINEELHIATIEIPFSFRRFDVKIQANDQEWHFQQAWFVAMCNQPYFGGGMKISPSSKPDDGQIEITIVHGISRLKLLLVFVTVFFEKHTKFKEITFLQGHQFNISVHGNDVDCHTDGNYIGEIREGTRIHCTVQRGAWQVRSEEH